MVKVVSIIRSRGFLFLLIFVMALFLAGCSSEKEPQIQCVADSDCADRTCKEATCLGGQCKYLPKPNCCGNGEKEALEDGRAGNECTCPEDYGTCEGAVQVESRTRMVDAKYLKKYCENDLCKTGVPPSEVRPLTLLDERDFNFFKMETLATYNDPFDATKDSFSFKISITDDSEELVFPVKITKIILRDGEVIFGERQTNLALSKVGNFATVDLPLVYQLQKPEETRGLTFKVNYEYVKLVKGSKLENGSYSYEEELVRDDYENKFSTKINFVSPDAAE